MTAKGKTDDLDRLIREEAEHADATRNDDYEIGPFTKVSRGHGRAKTLQVRLNDDEYAALEALAAARELPVSTVARSILLPALSEVESSASLIIERLRNELDLLSRKIA